MEITQQHRYRVEKRTHWWVIDTRTNQRIARHRSETSAVREMKRLNGQCLLCGEVHTVEGECPGSWPRDPNFGADYDEGDDQE